MSLIITFVICCFSSVSAQASNSDIHNVDKLVEVLISRDVEKSGAAAEKLYQLGQKAVPALTKALESKSASQRAAVGRLLLEINADDDKAISSLLDVLKNYKGAKSDDELLAHRGAAYALLGSAAGIRAMTPLIQDADLFVRRSVVFAFEEITESPNSDEPKIREAIKAAVPLLKRALKDKDEVVRTVAGEALSQFGEDGFEQR